MEHAIDKEAIVEGIFFGAGQPTSQLIPPGHWAYNPDITPDSEEYGYDPDRARELLAEAGYPDGVARHVYEVKDLTGYDLSISYAWTARWRVVGEDWDSVDVPDTTTSVVYPVAEIVSVITD